MGFEPLVNQRLLPPTFPRYTVIKSKEECASYMETLMTQLHILPQITEMLSLHTILVSICSQPLLQKHSHVTKQPTFFPIIYLLVTVIYD